MATSESVSIDPIYGSDIVERKVHTLFRIDDVILMYRMT